MKILLVTSPVIEPSSFSTLQKTPPLGIGYLIEILRQDGHRVLFKDLYLNPDILGEIESILVRESIDLLGVSINSICYSGGVAILDIAHQLREKMKWHGKIVVGGPHPSVFPETIPAYVDHVCIGEGEGVIKEIVDGAALPRIITGKKVQNLDNLPFAPYEEFITLPYHFSNQWINQNKVLTLNTSRGCPFSCQFCSVGSIWGNRYRFQSARRIIEEIIRLKTNFGVTGIYFREDNFTLNHKRVVEFCESLLNKRLRLPWICETRANTLTEKIVKLMARAGCRGYYIGAESGSQRVLDYMKKGITLEQVENVVNWAKKTGIRCYLSFVIGVPTETDEERYKTLMFIDRVKPYSYGLGVFTGIPFSPFYWQLVKDCNHTLISSSGIIYQKKHNQFVEQFVGNMDCKIPKDVSDETKEMLPILQNKMEMKQYTEDRIVILQIRQNSRKLIGNILSLEKKLGNPAMILMNCSGTDDVALALTALGEDHPEFIIKTVRPEQTISALNDALEIRTGYILFVDYEDDIDIKFLKDIYQEMTNNNIVGIFRAYKLQVPVLIKNLVELSEFLALGKLLDQKNWGCNGVCFYEVAGVDETFSTAYLLDIAAKLVNLGPIKIYPTPWPVLATSNDDYKLFSQALKRRIEGDITGLAALRHNNVNNIDYITKEGEAVVYYFRGRAKLRAKQFNLARRHFFEAFNKDCKLKYLIFAWATFLPSRHYSLFANMINKIKKY